MEDLKSIFFKVVKENYANFDGRARRKEYWMFFLVIVIAMVAINIVAMILGMIASILGTIVSLVGLVFILAILVPAIAVGVRRMHDVGKSGWFILIPIYSLVLALTDGTPGENEYGKNPKE